MSYTFYQATTFNADISSWDTSKVTDMDWMFAIAEAFNNNGSPYIGSWDTSKVRAMNGVFYSARKFDQNIGSWDTALVTSMSYMFYGATIFNQNLSGWNVVITPARPGLPIDNFATGSPLALPANSHKLPPFE
jgi:surface protein